MAFSAHCRYSESGDRILSDKFQKALRASRADAGEYGISPEASVSSRPFSVTHSLKPQGGMIALIERSISKDLLKRLRAKRASLASQTE